MIRLATGCVVAVLALAATGCKGDGAHDSEVRDSNRPILNRSIGDVSLGMRRAAVERRYGQPTRQKLFRNYFPTGTRFEGKRLLRATYCIHAGELTLDYVQRGVKTIWTTSPYYRTAAGVGAGKELPRNRCMRLDTGHVGPRGCKNVWGVFSFDGECLDAWLTSGDAKAMTLLYMDRGRRIEEVRVGDPDVILPCF